VEENLNLCFQHQSFAAGDVISLTHLGESGGIKLMEQQIILTQKHCLRCLHDWYTKLNRDPLRCPRCNSPYWNKPRVIRPAKSPRLIDLAIKLGVNESIRVGILDHKANWEFQKYAGTFPVGEQRRSRDGKLWTHMADGEHDLWTRLA
jgi:DNA-directed RNA polymerase subunit RPC12/RpoP